VVGSPKFLLPPLFCSILVLPVVISSISTPRFFAQTTQKVTLRLTDWADLDEMPLDRQAIAEFKQLYPDIDILYEPNPGRQYEEKILTALAVDDPPDVFLLDSKLIPTLTNKGVLLDLSRYVRELGVDTAQWFPNVLNIARRGSALYAFPKGFTPLMIYYLVLAKRLTKDLDDAARIDGASNWHRFWHVTFPLPKPTTFFILVTSFISSFQVFTSIYVMTAGGPVRSTDVIVYHIYQAAWEQLRMGYASAMSWVLFVIVMIATWIQFRMFGRNVEYG
jgi:maltose-binding protein MalE